MGRVGFIAAETAQFLIEQYPIDFTFLDVRRSDELSNFGLIEYTFNLPCTYKHLQTIK